MATLITYRRAGGVFTLLAFAAAAVAATVLTVAAVATVAVVAVAVGAAALGTRAVVSMFSRPRTAPAETFRTPDTIEATLVRDSDAG